MPNSEVFNPDAIVFPVAQPSEEDFRVVKSWMINRFSAEDFSNDSQTWDKFLRDLSSAFAEGQKKKDDEKPQKGPTDFKPQTTTQPKQITTFWSN
jgi:hypothetical protein